MIRGKCTHPTKKRDVDTKRVIGRCWKEYRNFFVKEFVTVSVATRYLNRRIDVIVFPPESKLEVKVVLIKTIFLFVYFFAT
jgi:hypothetical protein